MTTSVFHRRSAERFAELLDRPAPPHPTDPANGAREAASGPRHHARSGRDRELTALATLGHRVSALELDPAADPDPAFRAELRAMLVATAEREGIGATARSAAPGGSAGARVPQPPSRHRSPSSSAARPGGSVITTGRGRTRGAIIVGVAVGALALSGMSAASGDAMPGDPLYGVKRSTERAQLAFAGSDVTRGQLYLEFARTRLDEAAAVYRDADGLGRVLTDMDTDTRQGVTLLTTAAVDRHDPAALDAVDTFATGQRHDLGGLLDKVGNGSRDRLLGSLNLLDQVAKRSQALRETLSCGTAPNSGGDELGPVPRTCTAAGSSAAGNQPTEQATSGSGPTRATHPGGPGPVATTGTPKPSGTGAAASAPAEIVGGDSQSGHSQSPSPTPDTGNGLLDGLSRIVGDLLGG